MVQQLDRNREFLREGIKKPTSMNDMEDELMGLEKANLEYVAAG